MVAGVVRPPALDITNDELVRSHLHAVWLAEAELALSATMLAKELRREGFRSKQGTLIDKGYLYRVLRNRVYRGEAVHKGKAYPGEHEAIVTDKVTAALISSKSRSSCCSNASTSSTR